MYQVHYYVTVIWRRLLNLFYLRWVIFTLFCFCCCCRFHQFRNRHNRYITSFYYVTSLHQSISLKNKQLGGKLIHSRLVVTLYYQCRFSVSLCMLKKEGGWDHMFSVCMFCKSFVQSPRFVMCLECKDN